MTPPMAAMSRTIEVSSNASRWSVRNRRPISDGLPLVWRAPDGRPRTPGQTKLELRKGDLIRLERGDRDGSGPLVGRDVTWSVVVVPST